MDAGKPQKQAIATAYNVKKALGGPIMSDHNKMIDSLMKKRSKKLEPDSDFNTSPDLREQSSSLSNDTLFDDLSGTEMARPDSEEAMYAKGGVAYDKGVMEEEPAGDFEQSHDESTTYADGGPVLPGADSAQDSMRKSFGGSKYAEGGKIPQRRSYVQYGDDMHDSDGNDIPHHDSLPQGSGKEDAFYKPKQIGNQGRPSIDLNMYAPGGKVKMAYGQGRTEEDQRDTPETHEDEVSTHAFAEGGNVSEEKHLHPDMTDTPESKDEHSDIVMHDGGGVPYKPGSKKTNKSKIAIEDPLNPMAEGGSVESERHLKEDCHDREQLRDEDSRVAMAEGGIAYDKHEKEFEVSDAPLEHNEERYSEPVGDYGVDKDPDREAYYADGGPVQSPDHNPKSGELEKKKARKKMMIAALNE